MLEKVVQRGFVICGNAQNSTGYDPELPVLMLKYVSYFFFFT